MNWIDFVLVVVVLLALWSGWRRGFVATSVDLVVWLGSFILAYLLYTDLSGPLGRIFPRLGAWQLPLAFLLTLFFSRLLLGWLGMLIKRALPQSLHESVVNRFLGLVPGAINGWICTVVLSALLLSLPLKDSITEETRISRLAGPLAMQSEWANKKLAPVFDEAVRQTMNSLTVEPASDEFVSLRFTYSGARPRPSLEEAMLKMVNKERTERGLKPLAADPELTTVARAHSQDMFIRGYFAHKNPDNKGPFDRMKAAGIRFSAAGENLALAQTLEIAHQNLMNSPGHRANILSPDFGRLGIGVMDGGFYGLMISQEFRD